MPKYTYSKRKLGLQSLKWRKYLTDKELDVHQMWHKLKSSNTFEMAISLYESELHIILGSVKFKR